MRLALSIILVAFGALLASAQLPALISVKKKMGHFVARCPG